MAAMNSDALPTIEVRTELASDSAIVRVGVRGTLSFETYEKLEATLLGLIDRGHSSWVIDLRGVERLTTVAAAGLVGLLRVAQDRGGSVFVVEPTEAIIAIFAELEIADLMPWVGADHFGAGLFDVDSRNTE